jgi:hypothetical protein
MFISNADEQDTQSVEQSFICNLLYSELPTALSFTRYEHPRGLAGETVGALRKLLDRSHSSIELRHSHARGDHWRRKSNTEPFKQHSTAQHSTAKRNIPPHHSTAITAHHIIAQYITIYLKRKIDGGEYKHVASFLMKFQHKLR